MLCTAFDWLKKGKKWGIFLWKYLLGKIILRFPCKYDKIENEKNNKSV